MESAAQMFEGMCLQQGEHEIERDQKTRRRRFEISLDARDLPREAAKLMRESGGIDAQASDPILIGQIQIVGHASHLRTG